MEHVAQQDSKTTDRVEAFSDGAFAIVITLLGFELVVPELGVVSRAGLLGPLAAEWQTYLVFGVSFLSLLIIWINHHGLFQLVRRVDGRLMAANRMLLMFATAVPFATSILTNYLDTPAGSVAAAAYSALFVLVNVAYNLLWHAASTDRRLLHEGVSEARVRRISHSYRVGFPLYLLAVGMAFVSPYVSLLVIVALWILWAALPRAGGYSRDAARQDTGAVGRDGDATQRGA